MTVYDKAQAETMFRFVESGISDLAAKTEQLHWVVPDDRDNLDGSYWRIQNMIHLLGEVNGKFHRLWFDHREAVGQPNPDWDPVRG